MPSSIFWHQRLITVSLSFLILRMYLGIYGRVLGLLSDGARGDQLGYHYQLALLHEVVDAGEYVRVT